MKIAQETKVFNKVRGVEHSHGQINSRKEMESLKGQVLELETCNVLLEAKVEFLVTLVHQMQGEL